MARRSHSAYAISDDGTIVGEVSNGGFVAYANDPQRIMALDGLVPHGWHVLAAYAVAKNGDIVALAARGGAAPILVLLDRLR